ncbi:MAG: hypothetical protein K2W96_08665, partial [Gemmataceae bacterium]|nr:hypothetical protein [Gemmataceae bacterium]
SLGWTPDGRGLLTGGRDSTILQWDTRPVAGKGDPLARLAGKARDAHAAVWEIAARPRLVAELGKRLEAQSAPREEELAALIAKLDDDSFDVRDPAEKELARMGPGAAPSLRRELGKGVSVEVRRRLERLLKGWRDAPEALRLGRAVMALEQAGARRELERLAKGAAGAPLTEDAKAALSRLNPSGR